MKLRTLDQIKDLKNKKVLLRVDFNVPLKGRKVENNLRLKASLPTLKYLIEKGAKTVVVTHLGRPGGKVKKSLSVDPVIGELEKMLKKKVKKIETGSWRMSLVKKQQIIKQVNQMKSGQVAMMENIRFSPNEKTNNGKLGQDLADLTDYFVLDGFSVCHRSAASVVGVASHIPAFAGVLVEKEVGGLLKATKKPKKPLVVVLGGAKVATKVPVINSLVASSGNVLVGGAIASTLLKSVGFGVGKSLVDNEMLPMAKKIVKYRKIVLPSDVVVGDAKGKKFKVVMIGKKPHKICSSREAIYDIGPNTIHNFAQIICQAKTLVWNGAMGYFEIEPYDTGTMAIARLIASRSKGKAFGIIGGGETLQSMEMVGMSEYVDLVSTGGAAMLDFLAGKKLPGLEVCKII